MFKMYDNLFDDIIGEISKAASAIPAVNNTNKAQVSEKPTESNTNNSVYSAIRSSDKCSHPMDVYKEEDGSYGVELAVVGRTKDDLTLSCKNENGKTWLIIKEKEAEESEEPQAESKRIYSVKKIKSGKIDVQIGLPSTLDFAKLSAKVKAGLLTISIPVAEELKPIVFTIE